MLFIGIAIVWLAWPGTKSEASEQKKSSFAPLSVSFPAPELTLENLNGKTESLADYRSHVVLVNNWATWCPPCKAEMPVLQAYYEDHIDEGFKIVAVEAGDSRETVSQFAQSYGLTFAIWLDPDGAALRAFGNGSLPNSYVIDRQGMVRYAWTGEVNQALLEEYVTPLLAE
ncbi:MAG TPA: TlpA disulfide reductase family protein [Anaerolineales bacterium]